MSRTFTLEVYIENFITNVNVNSRGLDKQWTLVTMDILVVNVTAANEKKATLLDLVMKYTIFTSRTEVRK